MRTIRLVVEYDGTAFSGWQVQAGSGAPRTVQGELEAALSRLCKERIRVRFASRTDAGVHARGQVVAFETTNERIPLIGFERGPRTFLPPEIAIRSADGVPLGWNPRRGSRGKRYLYTIWNHRNPSALERHRAWWVRSPLDLEAARAGAAELLGHHDFSAFRGAGCVARHAWRTLYGIELRRGPRHLVEVEVVGNAFVLNMVRIIAGTLVELGLGKRTAASVAETLASRDRTRAGVTAPAHGLCLEEVIYDERLPPRPVDDVHVEAPAEDPHGAASDR